MNPERPVTLIGSCFSDNIGNRAAEAGWNVCVNPCGTLFNPLSIARVITLACMEGDVAACHIARRLFLHDGRWRNWDFSTLFSDTSQEACTGQCRRAVETLRESLQTSQAVIITLGTAWIYRLHTGEPVANCHKMPENTFSRSLASVEDIVHTLSDMEETLLALNPELKIIYTLSPVRHLRDGMEGNSLSKATLRLAIHKMEKRGSGYFPSFEILTDDLRDYRFYADDLLHPSRAGIEYIWEKFTLRYLDDKGLDVLKHMESAMRRSRHRPLL